MTLFGRKTRETRRRINRPAWISTDGDFGLRPCTVVDISPNGARLTIDPSSKLGSRFSLSFSRTTRDGRRCELRWQRGSNVGVKFVA